MSRLPGGFTYNIALHPGHRTDCPAHRVRTGGDGMETRLADLRYKEVINILDGSRYGYVGDVEFDPESGQIAALVVPGRPRLFGLLGRGEDVVIPWPAVRCFGEDLILVERGEMKRLP